MIDGGVAPIAVFLVVTPNPAAADGIGGINVAIIDDRYDRYLFDETLKTFMARYLPAPTLVEEPQLLRRAGGALHSAGREWKNSADVKPFFK
ncbi:hypothetical protein [Bradyrhizobium ottawaense]|uniref:hypothetical protein n=1 Tax=Bradyrhizobium ottawaense TaxID=931866 RepID=UPI003FA02B85